MKLLILLLKVYSANSDISKWTAVHAGNITDFITGVYVKHIWIKNWARIILQNKFDHIKLHCHINTTRK